MLWILESIFAALATLLVWRLRRDERRWEAVGRLFRGPAAVAAAAFIAASVTWYIWRSLSDVGAVHDEMSYLLQAEIFAHGQWTAPAAPIPAFFEQFHIFVEPVIASKYPPGHSLLLVPGIWLGLPGLVPVLLVGASGALIFALARRLTNAWVATLTFFLWILERSGLVFRGSYFSENTTTLCWLLGFWCLLEWRERREGRWLALFTACVAWGAITRPLTMVAYAIPSAVVVIWTLTRHRAWQWRRLAPAAVVGPAIICVLLVSNAKVTGSWHSMPWSVWSREYMPWDAPGFGLDTTPPRRQLPPVMVAFAQDFSRHHKEHTLSNLPAETWHRLSEIWQSALGSFGRPDVRTLLAPFALVGIMLLARGRPVREGRYAVACALALFVSYLSYAHPATWTVYYLESSWLLPFAAALGLWTSMTALAARMRAPASQFARDAGALPRLVAAAFVGALLWLSIPRINGAQRLSDLGRSGTRGWHAFLQTAIPDQRAIVFVRYAPTHYIHEALIANEPNLATARLWIVFDRGAENKQLAALAPERTTYLFDEQKHTLTRLGRTLARR